MSKPTTLRIPMMTHQGYTPISWGESARAPVAYKAAAKPQTRHLLCWLRYWATLGAARLLRAWGLGVYRDPVPSPYVTYVEVTDRDADILAGLAYREAVFRYQEDAMEDYIIVLGAADMAELKAATRTLRRSGDDAEEPPYGVLRRPLAMPNICGWRNAGRGFLVLPYIKGIFVLPLREVETLMREVRR